MTDTPSSSGGYSYGPAFTALAVPSIGPSCCFRGPAIRAYRHGPIAPAFRTGTHRAVLVIGPRQATTAAAATTAPGLGAGIDVYVGR